MFGNALKVESIFKLLVSDLSISLDNSIKDCEKSFEWGAKFAIKNLKFQLLKEREDMIEKINSEIKTNL